MSHSSTVCKREYGSLAASSFYTPTISNGILLLFALIPLFLFLFLPKFGSSLFRSFRLCLQSSVAEFRCPLFFLLSTNFSFPLGKEHNTTQHNSRRLFQSLRMRNGEQASGHTQNVPHLLRVQAEPPSLWRSPTLCAASKAMPLLIFGCCAF